MGEFSVAVRRGRRPRRAAGPLRAGLLFGGPAGLIAGAIGGLGLHMARTVPAKILGLYPSGRTLAPCHMRRYKRMRLVNLLVGALCIGLMPVAEIRPYPQAVFILHFLCFLLYSLIERFTLSDVNEKIPDFGRSEKP